MTHRRLHDGEVAVDEDLARRLIADQHPRWGDLPVRRVPSTGTDHGVFRLGDALLIRLPRIAWAEQQVHRESTWLPVLAPLLPAGVAVSEPVAVGEPGLGYPFRWLVSRWVPGVDLLAAGADVVDGDVVDPDGLARELAGFVRALRSIAEPGPPSGKRGGELAPHDETVRAGIARLAAELDGPSTLDGGRALELWERALGAPPWPGAPVWVHGDLLPGNVVVCGGRLVGVIDWSGAGLGDPACDLQIAWSLPPPARRRFLAAAAVDEATVDRAVGWVIEQTVAFIPYYARTLPAAVAAARLRLDAVLRGA